MFTQTNISTPIHTWIISPSLTHQGLYIFEHLIIEIKGMNLVYSRCMNDIHFVINIHHWYTLSRQCQLQITKPRTLFQILVAQKIHQDTYPDSKWHDARSIAHILINRRAITWSWPTMRPQAIVFLSSSATAGLAMIFTAKYILEACLKMRHAPYKLAAYASHCS